MTEQQPAPPQRQPFPKWLIYAFVAKIVLISSIVLFVLYQSGLL